MPSPSRWIRPLKRSTMPFVRGVEGRVLRWVTPSFWQAASNPSAVKQEPRSVSTWVTWKGKARTASFRKATAEAVVSSSLTARCTNREARSMATYRYRLRLWPSAVRSLGRCFTSTCTKPRSYLLEAAMRSAGAISRREAAQALGVQDAVDRIAIEMRQKVGDHKGEIIQRKAGCTP